MSARWLAGCVLAAALVALGARSAAPPAATPHAPAAGTPCATCHAADTPRVHTERFVTREHGAAAYRNRAACTSCHRASTCDACHARPASAPADHTAAFRAVRGAGRAAHVREARARPESCATCHAFRRGATCGGCHAPGREVAP